MKSLKVALMTSAVCMVLDASVAIAQDNGVADGSGDGNVIVVSGIRQSLGEAIDIKAQSTEFVDALVAEDIAEFPDANLAEALQRIPGITVDRSEGPDQSNAIGEAGTINLRGLGPNFTRAEINGMTATTAGQQRGFGFNILASEVFAAAVVKKSLTAKDNEGGLAGSVNLRTYRPFDQSGRLASVSVRGNYIEESNSFTPAATLVFSDKFAGDTFGIAAAVNFDRTKPRDLSVDALNFDYLRDRTGADPSVGDIQYPRGPRIIENDRKQNRLTATLTFQAQAADNLLLTFDNLYGSVDHTGVQNRQGLSFLSGSSSVPTDIVAEDDVLLSATFDTGRPTSSLINYEYDIQSRIYQGIITAEWQATDSLTITPSFGYSTAKEDFRKWDQIILLSPEAPVELGTIGDFTYFLTEAGEIDDPSIYTNLFAVRNRPDKDKDTESSARLDAQWESAGGPISSLEAGVRWGREKKTFDAYDGRGTISTSITDFSPYIVSNHFDFDGAPSQIPTNILGFDYAALRAASGTDNIVADRLDEASYEVIEESLAGYAMANFDFDRLTGNLGVRLVNTKQSSIGVQRVVASDGSFELLPADFKNEYFYALPSFNARFEAADNLVARFAIYRSLTRPDLTDIQPSRRIPNFEGGNGTSGNPELDPFTATNIDLGLEWYFAEDALVNVAVFRKTLNGLVERVTEEVQVTDPVSGQTFNVFLSRPINGESARVEGLEVGLQTPFSFLPGLLQHTGMVVNATFTDSKATFIDEGDLRNTTLPGLSKKSFNLIGYYDDGRFSARAAYNWRGDYLLQVSGSGGQPVSRDAYGQLDLSFGFNASDNLSFHLDVLNVTDEQIKSYSSLSERFPKALLQSGRRVTVGASYRF